MNEHTIRVSRTARYYVESGVGPCRDLWFVLHGYGHLAADFLSEFESIASPERALVAPEALSRYYVRGDHQNVGASWMTRAFRDAEIRDYVSYLDAVADVASENVGAEVQSTTVLGFSQGGPAAARWACLGNTPVDRLIIWGSDVPPDLDDEVLRAKSETMRLQLVVGTRDRFISEERLAREVRRLEQSGIRYELVRYDGDHAIHADTLVQVAKG